MNILYIDHYAGSLSMGMEFRPFYFAREWQKIGHKVRIIGADFSHLRKTNPDVNEDLEIQEIDGVEFQWIKTGTYLGNGFSRALTIFSFCLKLWRKARQIVEDFCPDVVIASSTYPLDTYPAQRIRRLSGCKYIHETHDLWPLTLTAIGGMSETHPFVVMMGRAESSAYGSSDIVVGVLPNSAEHMLKHGLPSVEKFHYIPNGIVTEDWETAESLDQQHRLLFDRLHSENKFIVCYLGGHALSNALDTLIDAAALTDGDASVAYVLVGKGVEKDRLMERSKNLSNIHFLPPVSKTQVPSVLKEADALYIGSAPCSLYRYGVSMNKVYDYMMAGKPIIYGVDAFNNDVMDSHCGFTITPDNPKVIIETIDCMKSMSNEDRSRMGQKGKEWVLSHYDYKDLAEKFMEIIQND